MHKIDEEAREYLRNYHPYLRPSLFLKRGEWWYAVIPRKKDGKRVRISLRTKDFETAVQRVRSVYFKVSGRYLPQLSLDLPPEKDVKGVLMTEVFDKFLESPRHSRLSKATEKLYRSTWENFWDTAPGVAEMYFLNTVRERHVALWAYGLRVDRDLAGSTYNSYISRMKQIFAAVLPDLWNPFEVIAPQPVEYESKRDLTQDELRRVLDASSGELRALLLIGVYTAFRLKDACLLLWQNIDPELGVIRIAPHKTRKRKQQVVTVPLHPDLRAALDGLSEKPWGERRDYVLPGIAADYNRNAAAVSRRITALFRQCGIRTSEKVKGRSRIVNRVGFHSLRHYFVTMCIRAGVPRAWVEELVGHSSSVVNRVYSHLGLETARSAIAALPSLASLKLRDGSVPPSPSSSSPEPSPSPYPPPFAPVYKQPGLFGDDSDS